MTTTPTPADMPNARPATKKPKPEAATETPSAYTTEQLARDTALRTARAVMQSRSPFGASSVSSWNPVDLVVLAQWILTGTPPVEVTQEPVDLKAKARRKVATDAS